MSTGSSEVRAHTPEPWAVVGPSPRGNWLIHHKSEDLDGGFFCEVEPLHVTPEAKATAQANAQRIVACVNMLAGIPTADLLCQPTVAQSVPLIGELVDAATEALKAQGTKQHDNVCSFHLGEDCDCWMGRLWKAIAAVKGVQS